MPRSRLPLAALLSLFLGLVLCQAEPAWSSTFTVTPVRVIFSPATRSALLTLRNQSPEALRFQLSLFAWDQSPNGEMQLTPTEDLVFFPTLLTLAAGEMRHIRVGPATPFASTEKTYRLFVEELPPLATSDRTPAGVRVLTRMGIPIFLQPTHVVQQGRLEGLAVRHGTLSFQVKNTGNVHLVEQRLRVRGFGPTEESLFEHQAAGWYVLAGGVRAHALELPKEACAKIRALAVEVHTEGATFQERVDVPPGACGP
jgi:fimbrial chaperone protein